MLDLNDVGDLLSIWRTTNDVDAEDRVDVILFVDAVALKPLVTIREDGSVEGIADFDCMESPDLFSQLSANPTLFHQFVLSHWKEVNSSLFVFTFNLSMNNSHVALSMPSRREMEKGDRKQYAN
jgi:hypothetical protein